MWITVWLLGVMVHSGVLQADHGPHNRSGQPEAMTPPLTSLDHPDAEALHLLEIYDCTKCHRLTEPYRLVGPSLWKLSERADAAAIRASILTPDAVVTPGYPGKVMYTHLHELGFYKDIKRQPQILERLVAYLAGQRLSESPTSDISPPSPAMLAKMRHLPMGSILQPTGQSVTVEPFFIDPAPITNAQYKAFIAAGGYTIKRYWEHEGWALVVKRRQLTQPHGWPENAHVLADAPVVGVSWYEAQAYCTWAGKTLPTDLQWQRACQEIPGWYRPEDPSMTTWEWGSEGIWHGTQEEAGSIAKRCLAKVPSYPALDGQHTGFRCALEGPAAP